MKKVGLLLCSVLGCSPLFAGGDLSPQGTLLELHSCELYAGGCIVSSELPQGGRYMLRAWNFTAGEFSGTSLAGLKIALLQTSSENLASAAAKPNQSVAYLPDTATPSQRAALLAWLNSAEPGLRGELATRVVPFHMEAQEFTSNLQVSDFISVKTASLESCQTGSCGEALWYTPRTAASVYTVAVNAESKIVEPLLKLKWQDAGKKSVFLARFGDKPAVKSMFVSLADLCGPAGRLF